VRKAAFYVSDQLFAENNYSIGYAANGHDISRQDEQQDAYIGIGINTGKHLLRYHRQIAAKQLKGDNSQRTHAEADRYAEQHYRNEDQKKNERHICHQTSPSHLMSEA